MDNKDKGDVYALLSLIFAVLGCLGLSIVGGGVGLFLGIKAKRYGADSDIQKTGMILSVAVLIISVLVFLIIGLGIMKMDFLNRLLGEMKCL